MEDSQHSDHSRRLQAIDEEQRRQEEQQLNPETNDAFSQPVVEQMRPANGKSQMITQEDIEYDEPSKVNWTVVVCTAIVVIAAVVILCVAKPWDKSSVKEPVVAENVNEENLVPEQPQDEQPIVATDTVAQNAEEQAQLASQKEQPETELKPIPPERIAPENAPTTPSENNLPVLATKKTGTNNRFNNVRLIDASHRVLTQDEINQMSKEELALARNAIYARHGYQFKNAELKEFFDAQPWFKSSITELDAVNKTNIEQANINMIQAREKTLK